MKTLHDWVKEARKASGAEAVRCLREAEALAERASHWTMLGEAWAGLGIEGHDEARRCAGRAGASAGTEALVYREAAAIYVRGLHDLAGARAVLDGGFEVFAASPALRASEWRYLAGGYEALLGDRDGARRCLESGVSYASSFDDLHALAEGYVAYLDDVATARGLLERATALAEAASPDDAGHAYWTLANSHRHALGDPEAAWRLLERGLERATTVAGCLHMAHAAASHAESEPTRHSLKHTCVMQAEGRAVSADDWILVAEGWHEHRGEPAAVRRCLDHALAASPNDADRARIAFGHRYWLDDAATADRLSPRGVAPAALVVTNRRLAPWQADPAGLLDWLRARITPKALAKIAAADYGSGVDRHLAALQDIQATGQIPQPLAWHPLEVLELTRWSDGERVDHTARAFACTVLLLDAAGPTYRDGHEATMPILLESCLALGDEAIAGARGLMVVLAQSFAEYRSELAFAYLGLLMAGAACDPRDPRLAPLAKRLVGAELDTQHEYVAPGWLLGQTRFDAGHRLWRLLAEDLLAKPSRADPSLAHLADIADRLLS